MGDPRKQRKQYSTPKHPWEKARIDEEKVLMNEYGFKNKKELWKAHTILKTYFDRAKSYVTQSTTQSKIEEGHLLEKLRAYGLLTADSGLGDVLSIELRDVLERRLQTVLLRRGLAHSVKQARQFIVHGHVSVAGKKITSPSYLVSLKEEETIAFAENSSLANEEHPERALPKAEEKAEQKGE